MTDDLTRDCLVVLENLKDHLLNNPAAVAQLNSLISRLRAAPQQPVVPTLAPRPTEPPVVSPPPPRPSLVVPPPVVKPKKNPTPRRSRR